MDNNDNTDNIDNINTEFSLKNITSSAKFENFEGLTEKEIIEKYDKLLVEREKEMKEISYQMGVVNEKYFDSIEKIENLKKENHELEILIDKLKKLINSETTDTQIMNEKINAISKENDELRKIKLNIDPKLGNDLLNYQPLFK